MTLDDAISHARTVAKNVRYNAYTFTEQDLLDENCRQAKAECLECASEHEQLAAWLEELAERREVDKNLEELADFWKDSLFGNGIRFALKAIDDVKKRDWESEAENEQT